MAVTDAFWENLQSGAQPLEGFLVGRFEMTDDPPHWEIHPRGDEFFHLISGAVDVMLEEEAAGERRVALSAGQSFIVPRGTWHRIVVHEPADMIFFTYGEGTRHRPV
jgi:mannose-6-phosphate isomerase-like protein (cupin superfamily)